MLDLARKEVESFKANNLAYCEVLVTCTTQRNILRMGYNLLVHRKKIVPIEEMTLAAKTTAYETAKDIAKGRLGRPGLIELVKALIVIEYFLNL
jgi:hypothetical protein